MSEIFTVPSAMGGFVSLGEAVVSIEGATLEQVAAASPLATLQLKSLWALVHQAEEKLERIQAILDAEPGAESKAGFALPVRAEPPV